MTVIFDKLNQEYISVEDVKAWGISNNLSVRLRATITEYDKLNYSSAQELIDSI